MKSTSQPFKQYIQGISPGVVPEEIKTLLITRILQLAAGLETGEINITELQLESKLMPLHYLSNHSGHLVVGAPTLTVKMHGPDGPYLFQCEGPVNHAG